MMYNEGEILTLYCKHCKQDVEPTYKEIVFKNNTKHCEARCSACGLYLKYMSHEEPKLFFGKYKGQTINEVLLKDRQYLLWLIEQPLCKNNLKNKIKNIL